MFKKMKAFFTSKKKKYYNPNGTFRKWSLNKIESNRVESFKTLISFEFEGKENIGNLVSPKHYKKWEKNGDLRENPTKGIKMDDFLFVSPIPEDRYNEVIVHLRNNFFADEPLNKCVGLCKPGEPHTELEAHSLNTLRDQLSVMAVDKDTNKVVAVSLNGVQHPGDIQQEKYKLEKMTDEKFKQIFTLLYDINEKLDLFSKYEIVKLFDARILSVDSNYRGKGLGKEIIKRAELVAEENGFKVMKGDATGMFSQKILISLGWELIHEMKYADHLDEQEEQIFKPPAPHESLKIMIKQF